MFQVLWTTLLNVAGVDKQPREVRGYRLSNAVQRSLAHLAAQDGNDSRLLLCDSSGNLYIRVAGSAGELAAVGRADLPASDDLALSIRSSQLNGMKDTIDGIATVLNACYDSNNYAIRTIAATP
jgi:hypothetical protein